MASFVVPSILSNHESPFRSNKYISKKIIEGARKISNCKAQNLTLGNINISRDWGWAPEYVVMENLTTKST